ncbi:MAG: hypothetical protein COV52_07570 [Gammaproteobacteria bacterium CG11_big_fil_rev_8_21_14_0_20_46_22]|nr:MAG: hypothetical protein COW05_06810 [Gammaproteobacteria bacterium CG12_big_fil_rev_8_21_14_0_65_46_12]PIR10739.1 MAG: hypothetical protein COV52_07570 [Gammaproteobacteria bacterium CG11_big_fil_rev_8_21_14_0_20_46_22]
MTIFALSIVAPLIVGIKSQASVFNRIVEDEAVRYPNGLCESINVHCVACVTLLKQIIHFAADQNAGFLLSLPDVLKSISRVRPECAQSFAP